MNLPGRDVQICAQLIAHIHIGELVDRKNMLEDLEGRRVNVPPRGAGAVVPRVEVIKGGRRHW